MFEANDSHLFKRLSVFLTHTTNRHEEHGGKTRLTGAMGVLVVCVTTESGRSNVLQNTAMDIEGNVTFTELYEGLDLTYNINEIRIFSCRPPSPNNIVISSPTMSVSVCNELGMRFVEYLVIKDDVKPKDDSNPKPSAFSLLMGSRKKQKLPEKPKGDKLNGTQKLFCDIVDWVADFDEGWPIDSQGQGKTVLGLLANSLWSIDTCHQTFKDNGCPVPQAFECFQGYNKFSLYRHRKPVLTSEKLQLISEDLAKCLSFPAMPKQHSKLCRHIESLLDCITKYKERLDKDNYRHQTKYHVREEPARNIETDSTCIFIPPKPSPDKVYMALDSVIQSVDCFDIIDLDHYSPETKTARRKFVNGLKLSNPVMLFRMAFGANIGTLNFLWKVPVEGTAERDNMNAKNIAEISKSLPKFSTRAMRRDFINQYSGFVKTPKSVLRHMFHELTGTEFASDNMEQKEINERVSEILLTGDDPQLLLDYRELNGKTVDKKFEHFFAAVNSYFDKQNLPVQERRHGDELYLPVAISVEDLKNQIVKDLPEGTPIPSNETIRLQFMPNNPYEKTALKYKGTINIKYHVQTRLARVHHQDARYVSTLYRYLKEFCVKYRDLTNFICMDDKAIIPVGEPGIPISTGVRSHHKALVPASGPSLVATDHDFHLAGLVPSVTLVSEIPRDADDSFFNGQVFVTLKDKVFEASSPFRHATETTRILREHYSDDGVDLSKPILCMLTDGGPDHRVTFETVKTSLLQMFMQLDIDILIAIRSAPNHSWVNPAERCMSILNLALQHVALCRNTMDEKFENKIKHKASLNAVRNAAESCTGLKEAFTESISEVIGTVNDRFSRMKLKDTPFIVYRGVPSTEMDDHLDIVREFTDAHPANVNSKASSKDLKDSACLQDFMRRHTKSCHYSFQIMKCFEDPCRYCKFQPPRLLQPVPLLPCPVPDESGSHYMSFTDLHGKAIDDSHRPFARNTSDFSDAAIDADKKQREILKTGKARDLITCKDCNRPRVIYSASKTTREQDVLLRQIREDGDFVCGDSLPEDSGLVVRQAINCSSDIEVSYYSASLKAIAPPCCFFCGNLDNLLEDDNEYIERLRAEYSTVRPICQLCRSKGLDAKTWGKKFFKKPKS